MKITYQGEDRTISKTAYTDLYGMPAVILEPDRIILTENIPEMRSILEKGEFIVKNNPALNILLTTRRIFEETGKSFQFNNKLYRVWRFKAPLPEHSHDVHQMAEGRTIGSPRNL